MDLRRNKYEPGPSAPCSIVRLRYVQLGHPRIPGYRLHCSLAAYHEAGHAVVALHYGRIVLDARISKQRPGDGLVRFLPSAIPTKPSLPSRQEALVYWDCMLKAAEREAKIALAGPMAEAKLLRTPLRSLGARADLEDVLYVQAYLERLRVSLCGIVPISAAQIARFDKRMQLQTRQLLARPWCWRAITLLAHELTAWQYLTGHDVAETVQWSKKPYRQLSLSLGPGGRFETDPASRIQPHRRSPVPDSLGVQPH